MDENKVDNAVLQAQLQAQEARTQASIVREIYAAAGCSHLGDWNGGKPVIDLIHAMADALLDCSERQELTDCADNDGNHYQSQWLEDLLSDVRELPERAPE